MFGNTTLVQQNMAHGIGVRAAEQGQQRAAQQFWRARFVAMWRSVWTALTGQQNELLALGDRGETAVARRHAGVREVPLNEIRGSEGRSADFDAAFNPRRSHNQDRWVSVAVARQMDIPLPAVDLIQVGDTYYVRDGHHRISVARAMGQATIDANVIVWQTK